MIKKYVNKGILYLFAVLVLVIPSLIFANELSGIVPCDGTKEDPCTFVHFFAAIGEIMRYIYITSFSIATILFAYAGVLLMTSQGDTGKVQQAKNIFKNVIIGVSIMFLAYWGVWMLLRGLGVDQSFYELLTG